MKRDEIIKNVVEPMVANIHGAPVGTISKLKRSLGKKYSKADNRTAVSFALVCPNFERLTETQKDIVFFVACATSLQDTVYRGKGERRMPDILRKIYYDSGTSDSGRKAINDLLGSRILSNGVFLHKMAKYIRMGFDAYPTCRLNMYRLSADLLSWNDDDNKTRVEWARGITDKVEKKTDSKNTSRTSGNNSEEELNGTEN